MLFGSVRGRGGGKVRRPVAGCDPYKKILVPIRRYWSDVAGCSGGLEEAGLPLGA